MGATSRYLTPGEQLIYVTRRHTVVLGNAFAALIGAVAIGLYLAAESHRQPSAHLGEIGAGLAVLGAGYFVWRSWEWWLTRYVITDERIVLIEGFVARRIKALPLRLVIDTTYRRTVGGRLLGYCDIDLNLSGQPGLRKLTTIPNADHVYQLIVLLLSGSGPAATHKAVPPPLPAPVVQPISDRAFTETHPLPPI